MNRRFAGKPVALRSVDIRQGDQPLPPKIAVVENAADRTHRIARSTGLDLALGGAVDPDRIAVEITDDAPDVGGGLLEDSAVKALRHVYAPLGLGYP